MAGGPEMPRPPYREEGILGPGGRKFIGALVAIAVLGGLAFLAFNIDFGELADELEEATDEPTRERPSGNGPDAQGDAPALSSGGLAGALAALREEVGANPDLIRVRAAPDGVELDEHSGNHTTGYRWSGGELSELEFVVVVNSGKTFPASSVDPASLGWLLSGAEHRSRGRRLEVVDATLESDLIESRLRWRLNAQAPNGSNLTFVARPDGREVTRLDAPGALGAGLPAQARRDIRNAQRGADCVRNAGADTESINECVEDLLP